MKTLPLLIQIITAVFCVFPFPKNICAQTQSSQQAWQLNEQAIQTIRYNATPFEIKKAIKLLENTAKLGDANAMFNLGTIYDNGYATTPDSTKAFNWYQQAARKKHFKAAYNLGVMYYKGTGTKQNYAKAAKWFKLAANAQYNYAVMLANGQGEEKNPELAARFLRMSGRNGFQPAIRDEHIFSQQKPVTGR